MDEQNDGIRREKVRVVPIQYVDDFPDHPLRNVFRICSVRPEEAEAVVAAVASSFSNSITANKS